MTETELKIIEVGCSLDKGTLHLCGVCNLPPRTPKKVLSASELSDKVFFNKWDPRVVVIPCRLHLGIYQESHDFLEWE